MVSVLIPAFNEEKTIGATIRAIKSAANVKEIIVIDDASSDKTASMAELAGADRVLKLNKNSGKGSALNHGVNYISYDIVALIDADVGESGSEVERLIQPVLEKKADLTIAKFPKRKKKGGFGFVKKLARWGIKSYTGHIFEEPLSGQRAMTVEALKKITPFHNGFGVEVGLTIKAIKAGLTVVEVETNMGHNETGRDISGFLHRGKQFVHVLKTLVKIRGIKV